jgi:exodeoxyribonuclease-3
MKIISWNVNGIRAVAQKGLFEFLERENPDVFCMQETKCHPDQLEAPLAAPPGWKTFWSSAQRPGYSGTAIFCKETPLDESYGIGISKFDAEGRLVVLKFKDFTIYNCYFPNGGSGLERHQYKMEFLKRFSQHLNRGLKAGEKIVVVGDYNVAYLDIDVYDPVSLSTESGFLPEEREWMRNFLEMGFIDSYRYFYPDQKAKYTWWSYFQGARPANRGWRIDHICISRNLEARLKTAQIMDQQEGSDHCPVVMELE